MKRLKHITRFFGRVAPELGGNGLFASLDELIEQRQYVAYLRQLGQSKTFSSMAGDVKSAFKGRGMELEEIRSYTYGDDVRDIDWRVTAFYKIICGGARPGDLCFAGFVAANGVRDEA